MNELPGYKPPAEGVPPEEAQLVIEDDGDEEAYWRSLFADAAMALAGSVHGSMREAPFEEIKRKKMNKPSSASSR